MTKFSRSLLLTLLWAALAAGFPTGAEAENGSGAIIFVIGDGARRDIMAYEPGSEAPILLAGEKGVMETQPTLGPKGETAWVRRRGENWELLLNGQVISGGPLHLSPAFRPDGALAVPYF